MTSTWVVGDVHGCVAELEALISRLKLGAEDELISVGDLFHRGPEPVAVYECLRALPRFRMVLGNHEHAMLLRLEMAGPGAISDPELLRGDRRAEMAPAFTPRASEIVAWLRSAPAFLRGNGAVGERAWLVVHGSVIPGLRPEDTRSAQLVGWHRLGATEDAPSWVHAWRGPELVVFGHRRSASGPHYDAAGALVAFGTDTGCVYGGSLTAFRLEDGAVCSVAARG